MFVVSFLSLQNLFHYLCEQTGGAVKLPDAKGVSACMLKTFILFVKDIFSQFLYL